MIIYLVSLIFIFGLFIGSFLNVLVDRLPQGKSPFRGRSVCDNCKHILNAFDLIPVVSYILLEGKCRYCGKSMGIYYPIIELASGLMFALTGYLLHLSGMVSDLSSVYEYIALVYQLWIISILIVIFFTDLKYGIIPFGTIAIGITLVILWQIFYPTPQMSLLNYLYAGAFSFLGFLLIFIVTKGKGIGFGDVIYALFMGILLGYPNVIAALYISFITGAIVSLILIALKRKKMKGDSIPFGPFLVLGTIISFFWGNMLIEKVLAYLLG